VTTSRRANSYRKSPNRRADVQLRRRNVRRDPLADRGPGRVSGPQPTAGRTAQAGRREHHARAGGIEPRTQAHHYQPVPLDRGTEDRTEVGPEVVDRGTEDRAEVGDRDAEDRTEVGTEIVDRDTEDRAEVGNSHAEVGDRNAKDGVALA
jgi:hypothetical protein